MSARHSLTLAAVALGLSACGGGGDGDGGSTLAPPAALAEITSANAPVIAGAVIASSLEGGNLGSFANPAPVASAPLASAQGPSSAAASAPSAEQATAAASAPGAEQATGATAQATGAPTAQARRAVAAPAARGNGAVYAKVAELAAAHVDSVASRVEPNVLQVVFGPETVPCTNGGSVTVSGDIADTSALTPGDTITFAFTQCAEPDGTVDGTFAMTVTSFSGDLEADVFTFGIAVEVTAFQTTADGETATANGDISMSIAATATPSLSITVTSNSLSISEGGASHTLTDYALTQTIDGATGQYTLTADGTLSSSVFSGAVSFETTATLQGAGTGTGFAFAGEMLITGADGATITLIVLDETFVRLEVDLEGDGTVDETIDSTWAELT